MILIYYHQNIAKIILITISLWLVIRLTKIFIRHVMMKVELDIFETDDFK